MSVSVPPRLAHLPIPPNYMRAVEQKQVREMYAPLDRPAGDLRSAQQIIDQSPVMTHFLQGRDSYAIGDDLKQQVGDWGLSNTDANARAGAAYNLEQVLRFVDNLNDHTLHGSQARNGRIDGFFNDGYGTLENSEASRLKAFSFKGYEVLRHLPS
ncbi:hypothetical protein [Pseudomonas veronii]|jgi:hypothetical protein|nr:hypothetical protein [Pseudomonas veronii]KRP74476.1 hypothetical protein TU80_20555 [Pseudomonas veronii]MCT9824779.1 hypothetical protein [Pseudomonas veronii]CAD0265406.1 conserved hypothetical protein [Pseudomonas veronii]SEC48268.1 hypothetical protein SAMN04490199_5249 [Pseudomonas marginalis]